MIVSPDLKKAVRVWPALADILFVPRTKAEYERAVALLDELIDEMGDDENSPLASLMETLGALIETYETGALPEPTGDPLTSLHALLVDHGLSPADLPELGDPATATDILQGRRELNLAQIRRLAERFGVSPAVFV